MLCHRRLRLPAPPASPHASASPPCACNALRADGCAPQAVEAVRKAAKNGDLATLTGLVEEKHWFSDPVNAAPPINGEAHTVSAAPPITAPTAHHQPPTALRPHRPPPLRPGPRRPPLTARGAAAAPPQYVETALMAATMHGKLDCVDYLIAKGARPNAQGHVRRGPHAAWQRRGVWS